MFRAQFSGPLPPPSLLREYEEFLPGAGDRIISGSEKWSDHQRQMESNALAIREKEGKRGQYMAFRGSLMRARRSLPRSDEEENDSSEE